MATSSRGSGRNPGRNNPGRNKPVRGSSGSSRNAAGKGATGGASSMTTSGAASSRERKAGPVSETGGPENEKSAAKRLFDLRWLIAGMFVVYGIVLIITGIFDSQAELAKAAGVRINLWAGIGMLVVGLFFAAWARWRPLRPD